MCIGRFFISLASWDSYKNQFVKLKIVEEEDSKRTFRKATGAIMTRSRIVQWRIQLQLVLLTSEVRPGFGGEEAGTRKKNYIRVQKEEKALKGPTDPKLSSPPAT